MAYTGFSKLAREAGGGEKGAAIAASIGRKKYGASAMAKAAASGKSLRGHKTLKGK